VLAYRHRDAVTQPQVALHRLAAQVDYPVRKARDFRKIVVVELEGRRHRRIQDLHLMREHLYLARAELRIDRAFGPPAHLAGDAQHEFVAHALRGGKGACPIRVAHHLRQAFAVAQVDEDDAAMVAAAVRPAAERDDTLDERGGELAAVMSAHGYS